jgi:hypothetical protein
LNGLERGVSLAEGTDRRPQAQETVKIIAVVTQRQTYLRYLEALLTADD